MTSVTIRGIPISFPFQPYDIQKNYMEKVLECLQNETNGVLESPTGTGKTLSLLCSSLAWLTVQKAKYQAESRQCGAFFTKEENNEAGAVPKFMWDVPTIIYASRTHSQLTQAMQELKRTSYSHVRATIIGSREQLCIHPDVVQQVSNANKTHMCQAMVKSRTCYLHNRVERMTNDKVIMERNISDIEDLLQLGKKHNFCPYYMARELKKNADIVFLPYNYLLDPKARRANQLDLRNSVIIFDEAHNVERVCEDSASFQLKSTDIALCVDEITSVMKQMEVLGDMFSGDASKDFSAEDLVLLKTMILNLETAIDDISLPAGNEGKTFEGNYIFEILEKAGINDQSQVHVLSLLDRLIQYLSTSKENPFQRTGVGLQILQDILLIVFQKVSVEFKEKIKQCYKVHLIQEEEVKKKTVGTWLSKATTSKPKCRILNYWCFSPNFGMGMLLELGVRSIILTSGTLAPLKPLISELGIKVDVRLESPHVVTSQQIYVKIVNNGPDGEPLNSSFQNRDNAKYVSSLGMTISNVSRQIPHGLLIFFPSYFVLSKCQESWQASGIWSSINDIKTIFVEPKTKDTFTKVMNDFYDRIKDPAYKGAIFMAVCRGKVSEGLDFVDTNGRAVIVTGIPYPPYKDPRVVLKRKYLDLCRSKNSEYLSGQDWYGLEATRAVNQAIGRVIRHRHDYGAIILLDNRFNYSSIKSQLSFWVRNHISVAKNFSEIVRGLRLFFVNAVQFDKLRLDSKSACSTVKVETSSEFGEVKIHKRTKIDLLNAPGSSRANMHDLTNCNDSTTNSNKRLLSMAQSSSAKRTKFVLVKPDYSNTDRESDNNKDDTIEFIELMKKNLERESFQKFIQALGVYKSKSDIDIFIKYLQDIFNPVPHLSYLIQGLLPYIKDVHKPKFLQYWKAVR